MRYGMVIDLNRCVGCDSCSVACRVEHGTPVGIQYHRVSKSEIGKYPTARMQFRPLPCMHCDDPACVQVCPTGASYRRDDGIVLIDQHKCIGCRYCILACPYESRQFINSIDDYFGSAAITPYEMLKHQDFNKGNVVKCDFCIARLEKGRLPACVESCPAQARYFGNLDDPQSEVCKLIALHRGAVLREELGTGPSVYYING